MQMKMTEQHRNFKKNKLKEILKDENEFIVDLLTTFDVPDSIDDKELDKLYLLDSKKSKPQLPTMKDFKKADRAQTSDELEARLQIIKNKMKTKKRKISERGLKKREAKKMKKNKEIKKLLVSAHKSLKNEKVKGEKPENEEQEDKKAIKLTAQKPIFNEEGKIVFSKFDFASHPGGKGKKSKKDKVMKNPKAILKKMKETDKKIAGLVEEGKEDKAKEMKQELAWKKVFDKIEGKKVKDDPKLLFKAIKKKKDQKKQSKKKWIERKEKVEHDIAQRQKKRQENINKKIKDKKTKKLKNLSKKGRVIPGF